jgi:hypothetical protein
VVRQDRNPSALLTILKNGSASTLDIVSQIKALLPGMRAAAPAGLEMTELFDQSIFVRAAINGVVKEGVIAALLTATMILLFLGSWRSTFIVMVSIPLSILASLSTLSLLGYTLNVMTLGVSRWPSVFSSMTQPLRSRTSIAISRKVNRSSAQFSTARTRLQCRHSSPHWPSVSSLCRSCF